MPADDDDDAMVLPADSDDVSAVRFDDADDDDAILPRACDVTTTCSLYGSHIVVATLMGAFLDRAVSNSVNSASSSAHTRQSSDDDDTPAGG